MDTFWKYFKSTQITIGSITAAVAAAAQPQLGFLDPGTAVKVIGALGIVTALLRTRPGAGASLTTGQASNLN